MGHLLGEGLSVSQSQLCCVSEFGCHSVLDFIGPVELHLFGCYGLGLGFGIMFTLLFLAFYFARFACLSAMPMAIGSNMVLWPSSSYLFSSRFVAVIIFQTIDNVCSRFGRVRRQCVSVFQ